MPNPTLIRITKFTKVTDKHYTARVTASGETIEVEYIYGSWWAIVHDGSGTKHRELAFWIKEALQEKMPLELRRRACELPKSKASEAAAA